MPNYSYAQSLARSYQINWRIDDILGARRFDATKRWLPMRLSGASFVTCLDENEAGASSPRRDGLLCAPLRLRPRSSLRRR